MIRNFGALLGLVALLAATVIGMLAVLGIVGNDISQKGPQFVQTNKQIKKESIDKTFKAGAISWTVHEARLTNKISSYGFPPETQTGAFIQITFTAKNTSDMPVTLSEESVSLLKDGTESPAKSDVNAQFVNPDKNILFNEKGLIAPGKSKEGQANFDLQVPFGIESLEEATGFEAVFKDPDPTTFDDKEIKLEFQRRRAISRRAYPPWFSQ